MSESERPGVTWRAGTWKVWRGDGTGVLFESDSATEAGDEARRRTEAGADVVLESPDGLEFDWDTGAGEWRSRNERHPVPAVLVEGSGSAEV